MGDQHSGAGRRPRVAAVTVTTNDRAWLADCFASLTASATEGFDLDLILVDNASGDGGAELVTDRFPGVRLIRCERNEGFAGANNRALAPALDAGADYVFLVNPDTRTPPDLIARMVAFMEDRPEYGAIGPMQREYGGSGALNEWSRGALEVGESHIFVHTWPDRPSPAGPAAGRAPETLEHAYVQGSALFCRAEVLRRVGLFDPAYHTYYEESDLCRRIRWAGWRVALCTGLSIEHYGGGGTRAGLYRRRRMLRNKFYFLFTDPEWRWRHIARLALRWLWLDLTRRGAAPAATTGAAIGDTAVGLCWLAGRSARMLARRRSHAALVRRGAGGPLRAAPRSAAGAGVGA